VNPDDDKLGTLKQYLAPNVHEASHGFPVYGLGQPTKNGIRDFVQALEDRGKQVGTHAVARYGMFSRTRMS